MYNRDYRLYEYIQASSPPRIDNLGTGGLRGRSVLYNYLPNRGIKVLINNVSVRHTSGPFTTFSSFSLLLCLYSIHQRARSCSARHSGCHLFWARIFEYFPHQLPDQGNEWFEPLLVLLW